MKMLQKAFRIFDPLFYWFVMILFGVLAVSSVVIHQENQAKIRDACASGLVMR